MRPAPCTTLAVAVLALGASTQALQLDPSSGPALGTGAAPAGHSLTTLFAGNGEGALGGATYFDVEVREPAGITVTDLEVNCGFQTPVGTSFTLEVYTIPGTYAGNETNPALWTLVASGSGVSNAPDVPTPVDVSDFGLTRGLHGFALVMASGTANLRRTNGNGWNQFYGNNDIVLSLGSVSNIPFASPIFIPRVWNGTITYTGGVGGPRTYCASLPASLPGCVPTIGAATDTASVTAGAGSYDVTLGLVPGGGAEPAILVYTTNGPQAVATTNAYGFLCISPGTGFFRVKPAIFPGGTPGICNGTYIWDFGNYLATQTLDPALVPGATVDMQAWYRDPPNPGTANLSNAMTFFLIP